MASDGPDSRLTSSAVVVIACLMATYIAGYAWSASIQDTARDVYYAYAIRHGRFFPLEGPILGDAIHLGPVWFYVLAIPLWVLDDWLAVAIFAGAIGSLKFPLAALCGTRLLSAKFGLLWAACLGLPGWNTFEQLIFFNPNAAAAIVLLAIALWIRARDGELTALVALGTGLTFSVALHIHPTTAPIMLLGVDMLRRASKSRLGRPRAFWLMAAGFAIPFVPYVVSQLGNGFPDLRGAGTYVQGQVGVTNLLGLPRLLWAYPILGPEAMVTYLWGPSRGIAFAFAAIMVLPLAGLAPLLASRGDEARAHRVAVFLCGGALIFSLWIALLRPTTPMYFVFALAPFWSGLAALGLWQMALHRRLHRIAPVFPWLALLGFIAVTTRLGMFVHAGEGTLSSRVLDVKETRARHINSDTWFPALGRSDLGRFLCARPQGLSIHGHLAYIVDQSVGVDAFFACGHADHVTLLGRNPLSAPHSLGMSREFWSRLDADPDCWIGSLGVAMPAIVWPENGIPLADGRRYFPRDRNKTGSYRELTLEFEAAAKDAVLISNVLHGYESFDRVRVRANGRAQAPIARNDFSQLYAAPPDMQTPRITWSVVLAASRPDLVDVVSFRAARGATRTDCGGA